MARIDSDMTQGSIGRHLLQFAVPLAIGLLFQQLYNTVDTIVVGQFVGKEAQAAVGSTGTVINTVLGFCNGLSVGSSVIISQRFGAHDSRRLSSAVQTTIVLTFLLSIAATCLGFAVIDPMLRFMQTPEDVMPQSHAYLAIYFAGVVGVLVYNMGSGILRAVGDSRRPLMFLIVSAVLNTVLDLLFVLAFDMAVEGVALATVIAQCVSALLVLVSLSHKDLPYGIRWRQLHVDMETLKSILHVGLPSAIQSTITAFSNTFVQSYVNYFGSACMAGNSIFSKVEAFLQIPSNSISSSATTFAGQNWGANQKLRARKGTQLALTLNLSITAVLGVVVVVLAEPLARFFSPEADVVGYAVRFIRLGTPFYLALVTFSVFSGVLRGIGDAVAPTLIMLSSFVVFRQIYLAVTRAMGLGFVAVALAYPVGWTLCAVLMFLRYRTSEVYRAKPGDKGEK